MLARPAAERFASLLDEPGAALPEVLADRYHLTRELGRGGMATVHLARDLKHARDVAIKVVHPAIAVALGSERFLHEIAIVAQLRHPHIVPLFDSGDADGVLYYVMPFETGPSLRQRLATDGPLPLDDAVLILRDVCDALAYAHQHGIVHRDIKPDNVLLSGRHALVTDFGVAKALASTLESVSPGNDDARPASTHALVTAGAALGTPAYMAPEQIARDPRIDHRADIYAVGVLAYELLTGRRPFQGETWRDITPHEVRLREAMQEQDGRARARPTREDRGLASLQLAALEPIQHGVRRNRDYRGVEIESLNGGVPGRTKPPIDSGSSPIRCSGHTNVSVEAVVTVRFTSGRSCAKSSTDSVAGCPSRGPGAIVSVIRFSVALSAPKSAPEV